jgi:hydrogenase nickel incorporation protein HypB
MSQIDIQESIYKRNDELAAELNRELTQKNVFCVNVMGAPGVGKTSSLIRLIPLMDRRAAVIEGDIESSIDAENLKKLGIDAHQINTHGACHLDSPVIREAADIVDMRDGYLFIENIGNLVCPAEFVIGEHIKMLITAVTEGSDKPYKYPNIYHGLDVLVINKIDLLPYLDFRMDYFKQGVEMLNPGLQIFEVSCKTGEGIPAWIDWLTAHIPAKVIAPKE